MLTAIAIENFKGISEPVRLELRPITLLFGQNSAGKSSLLHALNYFRAILDDGELDLDYIGGEPNGQRLGGFRNFVHGHDLNRTVRLRAEFTFSPVLTIGDIWSPTDPVQTEFPHALLEFSPSRGWVELVVAWHHTKGRPHVTEYTAGMTATAEDEDLSEKEFKEEGFQVTIRYNPDRDEARIIRPTHLVLNSEKETEVWESEPLRGFRGEYLNFPDEVPTSGSRGALPIPGELIESEQIDGSSGLILTKLLLEPFECLRVQLLSFRWIAAWRDVPPRPLVQTNFPLESNWSGGLAAWRELLTAPPEIIARLNQWLTDPDKLSLGFSLRAQLAALLDRDSRLWNELVLNRAFDTIDDVGSLLRKLPVEHRLCLFDELRKVELHPQDIGMGLLHAIPVLTACGSKRNGLYPELWGLDEPELHLHPKAQAAMGDLLLEAVRPGDRWHEQTTVLAATHSEHMVLRLLRRIRESNRKKGSGAGFGDGTGDGRGEGSGAGNGDGTGDGSGSGSGAGYGDGKGDSSGEGSFEITVKPTDIGVWYVDRSTGTMTLKRISVDIEGEFIQPWPDDDTLFEQDFRERYA